MDSIYIDIDSKYRNRIQFPNPYDFTIDFSQSIKNNNLSNSSNPTSDAYPFKEWNWNSLPPVQIITSGDQRQYNNGSGPGYAPDIYLPTQPIHYQYRVDNDSNGTGLTFQILTNPKVEDNILKEGEIKIATYGSGYKSGETLKIHRSDITTNSDKALVPILMTKSFITTSGYVESTDLTGTVSFTNNDDKWNLNSHGLENNDQIFFTIAVGSHPSTYVINKTYFVINKDTNSFQLSESEGGEVVQGAGNDSTSNWTAKKRVEFFTSGGSGSGRKLTLEITKYSNDELIRPLNSGTLGSGYKEGDILTILKEENGSGTLQVMLVDIRFRLGESYKLDISNIVKNNTIKESISSNITYHHANLQPLTSVTSTSGSGSGMIIATIEEPSNQTDDTSNILLLNKIGYIFEIGQNYEIGDTLVITDRNNIEHTLTIIDSNNNFSNKNNLDILYDNEILNIDKYSEPNTFSRNTNSLMDIYNNQDLDNNNVRSREIINLDELSNVSFNNAGSITFTDTIDIWTCTNHGLINGNQIFFVISDTHPNTYSINKIYFVINKTKNTFQLSETYNGSVIEGAGNDSTSNWKAKKLTALSTNITESLSSIKNITGNKLYLHNSRFFNLGVYDDFYKGLLFEDITAGTVNRIKSYDSINNVITLEDDFQNDHTSIRNFWKISNPSTNTKIFVPNGSDNIKDYINNIYEAIIYTGQINQINDFIFNQNVTIDSENNKQYKLDNKSIDRRIVHQYRTIIDYDTNSKMITLDRPLIGITSHANKFGNVLNTSINNIKYIHKASNNFQDTATGIPHVLNVFPIELETYNSLSSSPTNTNASGLKIEVIITDGTIQNINDINIIEYGSGYESQNLTDSVYTTPGETGVNYTTYV